MIVELKLKRASFTKEGAAKTLTAVPANITIKLPAKSEIRVAYGLIRADKPRWQLTEVDVFD